MQTVPRDTYTLSLSPAHPAVCTVEPGASLRVECPCAMGGVFNADGTVDNPSPSANPMAGPMAVTGIRLGTTVAVRVRTAKPVGYGRSCNLTYTPQEGRLAFLDGLSVPVDPSIGCIGAAPRLKEDATENMDCGPHGGNLDCRDVGPGATVFIRARVDGANLGFGDVHWAMGDGEIKGTGVEGAADVELTVHTAADTGVEWPWIVRSGQVMTLGAGPDLRVAQRVAYEEMMTLCRTLFNLERREVQGRITVAGDLRICQSVCRLITVRQCLPLELLGRTEEEFLASVLR